MANSRTFKANGDGWCTHCELIIGRGEMVRFNSEDELVHADCVGAYDVQGKLKSCPSCFTQLPRSGVCGYC